MATGIGSGIGAAIASIFGLPPQVGAAGGNFVEDRFFTKKKKTGNFMDTNDPANRAPDDYYLNQGGDGIMSIFSNLFGIGGENKAVNPYQNAVESATEESDIEQFNKGKEPYTAPILLGFPSSQRQGANQAIKAALAAKRGF